MLWLVLGFLRVERLLVLSLGEWFFGGERGSEKADDDFLALS